MTARSLSMKFLLLALLISAGRFAVAQAPQTELAAPPNAPEPDEISESEGHLIHDVRAQLIAEKFDEIDRTADAFRREKSRWVGGGWKLGTLYTALDAPHQTEKDTADHLAHLEHWMRQRPESITARVALATSLTRWAWVARGNGTADKVSEEGWQLFNQRIQEAQIVLEGSRDMKAMCPQWYAEEMIVGLAQGWDKRRMKEIFDRAIQFEPDFQHFYKERANYLMPKWYGSELDPVKFAKDMADHRGGDMGDWLYYEIASSIISRSNGGWLNAHVNALDWPRIQRGYHVLNAQFGISRGEQNEFAYMAYRFKDAGIAQQQFAAIGSDWTRGVWRQRAFFDRARDWANGQQQWP